MFVSMQTIRRGIAAPAARRCMASSIGSAMVTPAARRKVRRSKGGRRMGHSGEAEAGGDSIMIHEATTPIPADRERNIGIRSGTRDASMLGTGARMAPHCYPIGEHP
jgi:hypothetical protein